MKKCTGSCGLEKELDLFPNTGNQCKSCKNIYAKKYREEHKEKVAEDQKLYRENNKEKIVNRSTKIRHNKKKEK